jgi:hypothetical protein
MEEVVQDLNTRYALDWNHFFTEPWFCKKFSNRFIRDRKRLRKKNNSYFPTKTTH